MKQAKDCQNIQEIRDVIDEIDYQIIASFAKRYEYVREIVKFKSDQEGIVAKDRQLEVLKQRKEWAKEFGLDQDLMKGIFEAIMTWNIQKEMELFNDMQKATS
jgi:isochorismate pyruvate lyase